MKMSALFLCPVKATLSLPLLVAGHHYFMGNGVFSSPTVVTQTVKRNRMPPLAPGYSVCAMTDELAFDGMKIAALDHQACFPERRSALSTDQLITATYFL
jgi:hypothetical protein